MNEHTVVQLIEHHKDKLYKIAYSYVRNEQDALDAIQELTYRALKKLHTVQQPTFIETWLIRVLINICLDILKKKKKFVLTNEFDQANNDSSLSFELTNVIQQLPSEQQQLIYLKYFQELKNEEIATLQNIPEGTVKSRLHHILKRLRSFMREEEI